MNPAMGNKKCPARCSRPGRAAEQILGSDMYPVAILAQGKGKGNGEETKNRIPGDLGVSA